MRARFLLIFVWIASWSQAQLGDTIALADIIVSDQRLEDQSKTQFVWELNDSVITQNSNSLTELLNFNTPIYFKENGLGMVSSPSFRGTTAQQTSVLWNGININSRFLGQTDFNASTGLQYDEITVKPGGGSVIYGSGAIGGSVHLSNKLAFNQGFKAKVFAKYGSFNTLGLSANLENSNKRWSYAVGVGRNSSDNDFEIESKNYLNRNGNFWNQSLDGSIAYKLNNNNRFSALVQAYQDERHFAIVEKTATKTKYENRNFRSLLHWQNRWQQLNSNLKLAFLNEDYRYFGKLDQPFTSHGKLNTLIAKYDGKYHFTPKISTSLLAEYTLDRAEGEGNGIDKPRRNTLNFALLFAQEIGKNLFYEAGIRIEFNEDYESPLLYSFGVNYQAFPFYQTKLNISRNFRAPTFNDLYWQPGGNLNLKSENSLQFEWNHTWQYKRNELAVNLFYNEINDMIRWLPIDGQIWGPMNTDEVISKGAEAILNLKQSFGQHHFGLDAVYAYTISKNKKTDKQLSYVPYHKFNLSLSHEFRGFSWFMQGMYVGDVFSTTDESEMFKIKKYQVWNAGINYQFGKKYIIDLGLRANNVFNYYYQPLLYRPMPMRNYAAQIKITL